MAINRIAGCEYPALVEETGSKAEGILIKNVDLYSMQIITFFEGDEYQNKQVAVFNSKEEIPAATFVWIGIRNGWKRGAVMQTNLSRNSCRFIWRKKCRGYWQHFSCENFEKLFFED